MQKRNGAKSLRGVPHVWKNDDVITADLMNELEKQANQVATATEDGRVKPGASLKIDGSGTLDVKTNPPAAGTAAPKGPGTAAAGASVNYAREDHVHPAQTIPTASATVSGLVKAGTMAAFAPTDIPVAKADAPTKAEYDALVASHNKLQTELKTLIAQARTAGQML